MKSMSFICVVKQILVRAFIIASIIMSVRVYIMSQLTFYSTEYNVEANQCLYLLLDKQGITEVDSIDYMKKTNLTFIKVKGVLNTAVIYQLVKQQKFEYSKSRDVWEKKYNGHTVELSWNNDSVYITAE